MLNTASAASSLGRTSLCTRWLDYGNNTAPLGPDCERPLALSGNARGRVHELKTVLLDSSPPLRKPQHAASTCTVAFSPARKAHIPQQLCTHNSSKSCSSPLRRSQQRAPAAGAGQSTTPRKRALTAWQAMAAVRRRRARPAPSVPLSTRLTAPRSRRRST